ncbi:MAG: hypothetical protein WC551_09150 [Patescibacteria group bacterium]
MQQWLRAELQAMAENEIADMVGKGWLDNIKASDPHPVIKAFVIGHEGKSDILLNGISTPVSWVRKAVGWINDKIALYTPIFHGHGAPGDNSQEGRVPVGYVVGKKLMEVGDRIATVAAMYIFPPYKNLNFDVASIEAEIGYEQNDGTVRPSFIDKITAVALGNSATSTPGFPGATLVGALQAFADGAKKETVMPTRAEVIEQVKSLGLRPADLFTLADLEADPGTKRFVDEAKHDVYNQNVRLQTELTEAKNRLMKDTEAHTAEVKKLKSDVVMAKSQPTLATLITERKMPDKQAAFINLRLKSFKSDAVDEAGLKTDMNKFIDEAQAEYVEVLKSQGIDPATVLTQKKESGGDGEGEGKPPEKKPEVDLDASPLDNLGSPKTNPLLAPL